MFILISLTGIASFGLALLMSSFLISFSISVILQYLNEKILPMLLSLILLVLGWFLNFQVSLLKFPSSASLITSLVIESTESPLSQFGRDSNGLIFYICLTCSDITQYLVNRGKFMQYCAISGQLISMSTSA